MPTKTVRMHHPKTGGEIDTPEASVALREKSGWVRGAKPDGKPDGKAESTSAKKGNDKPTPSKGDTDRSA